MTELDARIRALSPRQRQLLEERLARRAASAADPVAPTEPAESPPEPPVRAVHGGRPLRWSLFFFSAGGDHDAGRQYSFILDCARFAERAGFEAIWLPERHFDRFGGPYPAPAVLTGAVAACTERLGLRAGSVVLPLHDPIRVAEEWAVIDNLSGGRAGVSLASGWHPNDFALAPDAYPDRRERTIAGLAELRALWAGEAVSRKDGAGTDILVRAFPRPMQREIPLWITASSSVRTWLAGARHDVNILTALLEQGVDELGDKAAAYREELRSLGRDPDQYAVTAMLHTFIGPDLGSVRDIVREPLLGYLRAHMELFAKLARSQDMAIDPARVSEADKAALAQLAFERYFTTNGLFGTPQTALEQVERLAGAGVTEIACLVDFGVEPDTVLAHLQHLDELRLAAEAAGVRTRGGAEVSV